MNNPFKDISRRGLAYIKQITLTLWVQVTAYLWGIVTNILNNWPWMAKSGTPVAYDAKTPPKEEMMQYAQRLLIICSKGIQVTLVTDVNVVAKASLVILGTLVIVVILATKVVIKEQRFLCKVRVIHARV